MPTGMLIKKIQRQEKLSVIQPPSVGPMEGARTVTSRRLKRLAAFVGLKGVGHDRLRHRLHSAAARSLDDPENQQHGQRWGRPAQETRDREDHNAKNKKVAPPIRLEAHPPSGSTMAFATR